MSARATETAELEAANKAAISEFRTFTTHFATTRQTSAKELAAERRRAGVNPVETRELRQQLASQAESHKQGAE